VCAHTSASVCRAVSSTLLSAATAVVAVAAAAGDGGGGAVSCKSAITQCRRHSMIEQPALGA